MTPLETPSKGVLKEIHKYLHASIVDNRVQKLQNVLAVSSSFALTCFITDISYDAGSERKRADFKDPMNALRVS